MQLRDHVSVWKGENILIMGKYIQNRDTVIDYTLRWNVKFMLKMFWNVLVLWEFPSVVWALDTKQTLAFLNVNNYTDSHKN